MEDRGEGGGGQEADVGYNGKQRRGVVRVECPESAAAAARVDQAVHCVPAAAAAAAHIDRRLVHRVRANRDGERGAPNAGTRERAARAR